MLDFKIDKYGLWTNQSRAEVSNGANTSKFEKTLSTWIKDALKELKHQGEFLARELAERVQTIIQYQIGDWEPLSPSYAAWKERMGLDDRMLVATSNYMNLIEVQWTRDRLGRFTSLGKVKPQDVPDLSFRVGLPTSKVVDMEGNTQEDGLRYTDLARILEFGTEKIPPRPHFAPAYAAFVANDIPKLTNSMGAILSKIRLKMHGSRTPKTAGGSRIDNVRMDPDVRPDSDIKAPRQKGDD
jgi:hypothetical protein